MTEIAVYLGNDTRYLNGCTGMLIGITGGESIRVGSDDLDRRDARGQFFSGESL